LYHPAQFILGHCYETGIEEIGLEINLIESFNYFKLSADQGSACGQYFVGLCYHYGKGIDIDLREAFLIINYQQIKVFRSLLRY
jgi:TPR repeat protein